MSTVQPMIESHALTLMYTTTYGISHTLHIQNTLTCNNSVTPLKYTEMHKLTSVPSMNIPTDRQLSRQSCAYFPVVRCKAFERSHFYI